MASLLASVRGAVSAWRATVTRRTEWWVTWALLFGISALWSVSGPLFSGPDEPSHVIKGAAVARGQLLGSDRPADFAHDPSAARTATFVRVPQLFIEGHRMPNCYAFRPDIPAGCAGAFTGPTETASIATFSGHYQPAYYALVGLPTTVLPSAKGVFLMRFLGGALCSALLASALASASSSRRPGPLVLGTALAITPMVLYTASTVNPSGLEISAALCAWVSALVFVADLDGTGDWRLVARIGVSAALLALSRGLSPLWLVVIGVVTLAATNRGTLTRLARRRDVRLCALGLVAATGLAVAWLTLAGTLEIRDAPRDSTESVIKTLRASLGDTDMGVREMIGWFGWLDVEAPALTRYLWLATVGSAVLGAFALGRRRYVVALAVLLVTVVVLPVVLETVQAPKLGRFWQGRYTLPLAVGVPPLAALAISDRIRQPSEILSRLAAVVLGALALGHVLAYAVVTRRYTVGTSGPIMYVLDDDHWRPPLPAWALLVGFVVAAAVLAAWLHRLATQPVAGDGGASAVPEPPIRRRSRPATAV